MDINVQAFRLVQEATEEVPVAAKAKRVAARTAGLKGGSRRAASLSPERRKDIARKASAARWGSIGTTQHDGA